MTKPTKLQIEDNHWQIVDSILHEYLSDCEIYAFGSRTRMSAKTYSDLDLAVQATKPVSHRTLARVSLEFEESDLPWSVDLINLSEISPAFKEAITQDLVLIKSAATATSGSIRHQET